MSRKTFGKVMPKYDWHHQSLDAKRRRKMQRKEKIFMIKNCKFTALKYQNL